MTTTKPKTHRLLSNSAGVSLVELLIVAAIMVAVGGIAVPQIVGMRRLWRSSSMPREIVSQLRLARQQAMTQRRAVTFQYDDATKQISIIRHATSGPAILVAGGYPNTNNSVVVNSRTLAGDGVVPSEISYGIPSGVSVSSLDDTTSPSTRVANAVNVTFQPDGSVIDSDGDPLNSAIFIFNSKVPLETASAISVLGSSGRIKLWRYSSRANKYVE